VVVSEAVAYAIAAILVYGTEAFILSKIAAALAPSSHSNSAANNSRGLEVAGGDTATDGYAVFGAVRCAGVNVIEPITGGANGQYLEQIIAHTIHEIYGLGEAYIDDVILSADGDYHAITGASTDGQALTTRLSGKVWVRGYMGTSSQTVDWILNNRYSSIFTSDFRGRGRSYTAYTFAWGDGSDWNGLPLPLREVWGYKCYDPRKDSTNGGSGSHRLNSSTTWEWTQNPALGWAAHAMADFGGRVNSGNINWPAVAAAADVSDAFVPVPTGFTTVTSSGNISSAGSGTGAQLILTKTGGGTAWNEGTHSTDEYASGIVLTAHCNADLTSNRMFGLSVNPAADDNYTSIDYAWNFSDSAQSLLIYESGVNKGNYGIYTAATQLKMTYDGEFVRYYIDGRCVRTKSATVPGATMGLDSSFYTVGGSMALGSEHRYTFNGRFQVSQTDWRQNSKLFVDAMVGRMVKRGSIYYIYAGAWTAASFAVGRTDWTQLQSIKSSQSRDGGTRWNAVHVFYLDPMRNWQREQCLPRTNPTFETADGSEQIPLVLEQPACKSEYEAQRKGEFMNRRSRNQIALVGILPPRFRFVCAGDVGSFTFPEIGWSSKVMRVVTATLLPDSSIQVGIAEEQSTDWTDLAASEYNQPSAAQLPPTNPTTPSEATLTISPTINGTLRFSMASPFVRPRDTRFKIVQGLVSSNAAVGSVIYDGLTQQIDMAVSNSPYYYWSQTYADSYVGPYSPNTTGILATPNPLVVLSAVNCITTQVFSESASIFATDLGHVDFAPMSMDADVTVTATLRAGVGNISTKNNVKLVFATGVTSLFAGLSIPFTGNFADMRGMTLLGKFRYTKGNSAQVSLSWDTQANQPNSVQIDNVSILTQFNGTS